jgi:tRNA(adenine34) deaminase
MDNEVGNFFMQEAILEARKAAIIDEVPVGAVIVKNGIIIARAHNLKETLKNVSAHAEMLAIDKASAVLNTWRLDDCNIYVTLEPCPMCAGAIIQSRIKNLYIGTFDPTGGACGSVIDLTGNPALNFHVNVNWLYDEECSILLTDFFKRKRK